MLVITSCKYACNINLKESLKPNTLCVTIWYQSFCKALASHSILAAALLPHQTNPMATSKPLIQITATNHFPIKLTPTNFPVWRTHVQSTLIGFELEDHITGDIDPPTKTITENNTTKTNPEYTAWFRQDQIVFSAILGSCTDAIQPLIASASTAKEAWNRLTTAYASSSRSRIISLKSKLAKNPKGNRSIVEFLNDMRSIADELALVQSPVNEEDLLVHILSQLGEEYSQLNAALKARQHSITYPELFDMLVDHERSLKEIETTAAPLMATVNFSQRHSGRPQSRVSSDVNRNNRNSPNPPATRGRRPPNTPMGFQSRNNNRSNPFCQFCSIPGHDTRECRKLQRFLTENHITFNTSPSSLMANATFSGSQSSPTPQSWMFDSGASHHLTSCPSSLHSVSEYGGPDEIILGDGSQNGGASHAGREH
ncbi:putative RNA-directed DNA polymerase [Helianthus debilis subsp. tardiflorus]